VLIIEQYGRTSQQHAGRQRTGQQRTGQQRASLGERAGQLVIDGDWRLRAPGGRQQVRGDAELH
jgi:hypothetical protein